MYLQEYNAILLYILHAYYWEPGENGGSAAGRAATALLFQFSIQLPSPPVTTYPAQGYLNYILLYSF